MARTGSGSALSIDLIAAVWDLHLGNSTDKLVLLALADYASPEGRCWPSILALSQKTELSKRTVNDSIVRLKTAGYLEVIHRHRHSNVFTLRQLQVPLRQMRLTPAATAGIPAASALRTVKDPSSEPSKNLRAESVRDAGAEKVPEIGVIHRKEPKHSEEFMLTARARVLCFRTKMGDETWAEYRAKLDRHEADNPITAGHLWNAVEKRRLIP